MDKPIVLDELKDALEALDNPSVSTPAPVSPLALAPTICSSKDCYTFGVQLPSDQQKLVLPPSIGGVEIRVDQQHSPKPAVKPRTLVFFLGPPEEHFQGDTWDFKPGYSAFVKPRKKGSAKYAHTLQAAADELPGERSLDSCFLADGVPVVKWPKQGEKLQTQLGWSDFFLCVTWVRTLVIAIQPEEVYFSGGLSHLVGLLGLCTVSEHLARSVDNAIEKKQITLQNWMNGDGRRRVLEELKMIPLVDVCENGLRPKFITVMHPGAHDAKATGALAAAFESGSNKEEEKEQKQVQEQKKSFNFNYWQDRSAQAKPRDTPKRAPSTPKATSPSTTTPTSITPVLKREDTAKKGKTAKGTKLFK